ncbi:MAG: hypothetical protein ACRD2Q_05070 [Terriglobales bacterium]
MQDLILAELRGGLWHTTHPDRFNAILASGAILPEPGIQNWKAVGGEDCCSYARKLGAVSLFDFDEFDPEKYGQEYRLSSWHVFVPFIESWGGAVWIEIDRQKVASCLVSRSELVNRWNSEKAYKHNLMPYIEAVHVGPLPRAAFHRALLVREGDSQLSPVAFWAGLMTPY